MLNITPLEAAQFINNHLGLGLDIGRKVPLLEVNEYEVRRKYDENFKKWELKTFKMLREYLLLLKKWKETKSPLNTEDEFSEKYVEALKNIDYIEYLLDEIFINGTIEDKKWFFKNQRKFYQNVGERIKAFKSDN